MTAERLLPVAEVADLYGVSKNYVYELISRGELRSVNLPTGRAKTRIPESALAEFIKANTRKPKGTAA